MDWQRLPVFSDANLKIINVHDQDSLWLIDQEQRLLLWQHDQTSMIQPPRLTAGERLQYATADHRIMASLTNPAEQSQFFMLDLQDTTWTLYEGKTEVPVRNMAAINAQDWIAAGDWGRIIRLSAGTHLQIPNPLSTHVLTLEVQGADSIWFGTRNDGLYRMNQAYGFTHHEHPALKSQDIIAILPQGPQGPIIVSDAGWIYKLEDSLTVQYSTQSPLNLVEAEQGLNGGIVGRSRDGHLYTFTHEWQAVMLPTHHQMHSLAKGNDGHLYLSGPKGLVLFETGNSPLQFFNYADYASVESSSSSLSQGGFFRDINGDDLPDLLVQNSGINQPSRLYLNHGNYHFSDHSEQGGLFERPNLQNVLSTDLDRDGNQDLLLLDIFERRYRLTTRYQVGLSPMWCYNRVQLLEPDDRHLTEFSLWDVDEDGATDILTSYRYDPEHRPGTIAWLENYCGRLKDSDSLFQSIEPGWWIDMVPLALERDGNQLFYLGSRWGQDRILAQGENQDYYGELMPDEWETQTIATITADLNNDGFGDLIRISRDAGLEIFLWSGDHFDLQNAALFRELNHREYLMTAGQVAMGDFDNNGYLDLFVSPRPQGIDRNLLFLNHQGKDFIEVGHDAGVDIPVVRGIACADVDRDGDLDIYGFRDGPNTLWVNNHNRNDFLAVQVKGAHTNPDGLGAVLWVYPGGRLDQADYLWVYRRVDIYNHNSLAQSEAWQHIGLDTLQVVDLRVRFQDGREIIRYGLKAGSRMVIWDRSGFSKALAQLPWITLRHFRNRELQLNLLAFSILLVVMLLAVPRLQAFRNSPPVLTLGAIIGVVTLFWVLSYVFRDEGLLGVFILPLGVPLIISSIPLAAIWIYKYLAVQIPVDMLYDSLLEKVMVFSHGAWAQRNLQGVLLHLEHLAAGGQEDEEVRERLSERLRTLIDLTLPALSAAMKSSQSCGLGNVDLINGLKRLSDIQSAATRLLAGKVLPQAKIHQLIQHIREIQVQMRQIRHQAMVHFTVDLGQVIRQVTDALADDMKIRDVRLDLDLPQATCWGLVKTADLAAILDNAIHNSMKAMEHQSRRKIEIRLLPQRLHQVIEIKDTGRGIPGEKWETIFQPAESGSESTGTGLSQSRTMLKTVSGSIRITESSPLTGTTLTIKLQKGRYEESSPHSDH